MEFIFKKSAGCEDFHEELRGLLKERYDSELGIYDLMSEFLSELDCMSIKRKVRDGVILYEIACFDIAEKLVYIDYVTVGG